MFGRDRGGTEADKAERRRRGEMLMAQEIEKRMEDDKAKQPGGEEDAGA